MKYQTSDVIVVEGAGDVRKLITAVKAEYIITKGYEVSRETVSYLSKVSEFRRIILLLDDDEAGRKIRNKLSLSLPSAVNLYIKNDQAGRNNKRGVAETTLSLLEKELLKTVTLDGGIKETLSMIDLYELGLTGRRDSAINRKTVTDHYELGNLNAKTLLSRLNGLQVGKEEIKSILHK